MKPVQTFLVANSIGGFQRSSGRKQQMKRNEWQKRRITTRGGNHGTINSA